MTRWLSADEQQVWRAYLEATRALHAALDGQLQREADMPHTYYEILVRLSEIPDRSMRMRDLADATRSSRSRLTHAVDKLEARGWVCRRDCPTDKRGQVAVLTDAGFRVLAVAAPTHVEEVRRVLFDPLTAAQIGQLGRICEALVAHNDQSSGDQSVPCDGAAG
jgi:DNA-binding MarR family transcriptional regulator